MACTMQLTRILQCTGLNLFNSLASMKEIAVQKGPVLIVCECRQRIKVSDREGVVVDD